MPFTQHSIGLHALRLKTSVLELSSSLIMQNMILNQVENTHRVLAVEHFLSVRIQDSSKFQIAGVSQQLQFMISLSHDETLVFEASLQTSCNSPKRLDSPSRMELLREWSSTFLNQQFVDWESLLTVKNPLMSIEMNQSLMVNSPTDVTNRLYVKRFTTLVNEQ